MSDSVVNHIVRHAPAPGHHISVVRLDGTESVKLEELYARSERVAMHLRELGIGPGSRVGILATNSLEWILLDLAALRLKAVTAGLEPGKFDPDAALLDRYGLDLVFTDRPTDTPRVRSTAEIRALFEVTAGPQPRLGGLPPVEYAPRDVTTIKFTSGSTGVPKGLAATVGSIDSSINAVQGIFGHGDRDGDNLFVFLPLSLLQQRYWVYSALRFGHDVTISTYEAAFLALRRAQPTVVMGVPGFFETAKKHIESQLRHVDPAVGLDKARRAAARRMFGENIRYLWTGSAPAGADMLAFFNAAGLPIYEGYGLNETCIVSKNHPGASREGSVGRVLPGKHVIIDEHGVVSVRSDHPVNVRYEYAAPGDSERVFAPDGTVRTGDLGYIDDDGFLFIRGRADDVIVLGNGRKVIVRPIEERLKASPAIEECVLFCPTESYLVAVVSPADLPADEASITAQLYATNAASARDEQIRKVVVADERFSIENGLLTSQFKPKRKQILEMYRTEVNSTQGGIHAR